MTHRKSYVEELARSVQTYMEDVLLAGQIEADDYTDEGPEDFLGG